MKTPISFREFLIKKDPVPKTLVQARVDSRLVDKARKIMSVHKLQWNTVIEVCIKKFIDEMDTHA